MAVSQPPPPSTFGNLSQTVNTNPPQPQRPPASRYVITDDIPAPPSITSQPPPVPQLPPNLPASLPPSIPNQPPSVNNPLPPSISSSSSFASSPQVPPSSSPFYSLNQIPYQQTQSPPFEQFEANPPPIPTRPTATPQFSDFSFNANNLPNTQNNITNNIPNSNIPNNISNNVPSSLPQRPPPPSSPFVFNQPNPNMPSMNEILEKEASLRAMEEEMRKQQEEVRRQQEELQREAERVRNYSSAASNAEMENQLLQQKLNSLKQRLVGQLKLRILEARGLQSKLIGASSDPYVTVILDKYKEKTSVIKHSNFPKWNSEFDFFVTDPSLVMNISVFDKSKVSHDSFLGKVEIAIKDLPDGVPTENWHTLQPKQLGKKAYGEIKLGILYRKEN